MRFFLLFISFISISCTGQTDFSLSNWIVNKRYAIKAYKYKSSKNCDSLLHYAQKIELNEFRREIIFDIADCQSNSKTKINILNESVKLGIPITKVLKAYPELNVQEFTLHNKYNQKQFWKNKDTSYLRELENRFVKDQVYLNKVNRLGRENTKELEDVVKMNTLFLTKLVEKKGFPSIPPQSVFDRRRRYLQSSYVLFIHSEKQSRQILLKRAIESASVGKTSWQNCLIISESFLTKSDKNAPKPLSFLYFKKDLHLDKDKSLLQLYTIKDLYDRDFPNLNFYNNKAKKYKVTIRPSPENTFDGELIKTHFKQIRDVLVNELMMDEKFINFSQEVRKEMFKDSLSEFKHLYELSSLKL